MSRAAWAGLLMIGGGLGLVAFLLTRGVDTEALAAVDAAQAEIAAQAESNKEHRTAFDSAVAKDKAFLADLPEIKKAAATLAAREKAVSEAQALLDGEVKTLVEGGRHSDSDRIMALAASAMTTASSVPGSSNPAAIARHMLRYKTDHANLVKTAREQVAAAQVLQADTALQQQIELASTRYPEARAALQKRKTAIDGHAAQVAKSGAQLEQLAGAAQVDYLAAGRTADAVGQGAKKLQKMSADLRGDVATLGKSIDKILVDMKEEGGRHYHKYRIIENGVERKTGWQEVTRSKYQQHRDHLGMAIYSKPEGKLEEDAETVAAPPGYNYVGNTRYGYWEQRNGQSFWVFYGKYALMRDLLWGPGRYSPIYRNNYRTYRSTIRSGKPWYGAKKQYGTKGSTTKVRYSNSNYYKQSRRSSYSGSRYSGSGNSRSGRFSGSRYSGSSSGRSYSGGSRGGSRGSRYRSSSFGGRGK